MKKVDAKTRSEIEALIYEHNWLLDHGHADQLWKHYTEDAVSEGPMGTMNGAAKIREWGEGRVKKNAGIVRHMVGGIRLSWEEDVLKSTIYYFTFRDSSENPLEPASVGEFREEYALVGDEWKIARREIVPIFGGLNAAAHAKRVMGGNNE